MDMKNIVLLAIVAILIIAPLVIYNGHGEDDGFFGGADDAGGVAIENDYNVYDADGHLLVDGEADENATPDDSKNGTYNIWFTSLWEPPSGEIESLLFALQAAIGAIIIGYIFGFWHGGNKAKKE